MSELDNRWKTFLAAVPEALWAAALIYPNLEIERVGLDGVAVWYAACYALLLGVIVAWTWFASRSFRLPNQQFATALVFLAAVTVVAVGWPQWGTRLGLAVIAFGSLWIRYTFLSRWQNEQAAPPGLPPAR